MYIYELIVGGCAHMKGTTVMEETTYLFNTLQEEEAARFSF